MSNILLINEKHGKMDLSTVKDAAGKMVILQPKGTNGSTRECLEEVLEHPHVEAMIKVKWLRYEPISLTPEESVPAPPVVPPVETSTVPPVVPPVETSTAPPVVPPTLPVAPEETPPVETSTAPREPEAPTPAVPADEPVDNGESPSASISSNDRRKNRRDR
jgi:hypothetical protein